MYMYFINIIGLFLSVSLTYQVYILLFLNMLNDCVNINVIYINVCE